MPLCLFGSFTNMVLVEAHRPTLWTILSVFPQHEHTSHTNHALKMLLIFRAEVWDLGLANPQDKTDQNHTFDSCVALKPVDRTPRSRFYDGDPIRAEADWSFKLFTGMEASEVSYLTMKGTQIWPPQPTAVRTIMSEQMHAGSLCRQELLKCTLRTQSFPHCATAQRSCRDFFFFLLVSRKDQLPFEARMLYSFFF